MEPANKLDNPVWHSLNELHRQFCINDGDIKWYDPAVCPFGGCSNDPDVTEPVLRYAKHAASFFLVGNKPRLTEPALIQNELVCLQMVLENFNAAAITENIFPLNHLFEKELFELVNLVQPGYFRSKTSLLGNYYGIFKNNRLVSVCGERMKMNDANELSAIVTHPDHTGNGYARQLITHAIENIQQENKLSFLHVAEQNTGAVALYEKMGFATRRKISFWNFF